MKKSKSYEERIQNQFGGFCTRVLKNEAKYIYRELSNQAVKEKVFDELSDKELSELAVYDNYFNSEHVFNVHGKEVVVTAICWRKRWKNFRRIKGTSFCCHTSLK